MTDRVAAPIDRSLHPLWQAPVSVAATVKELVCDRCELSIARALIAAWHSSLPVTQSGPWKYAFAAHKDGIVYAVALWNNPSARTLPSDWLELRRLAVSPDAPHCTASWMLSRMARWLKQNTSGHDRLISYQDTDVHAGTIYKAAGWTAAYTSTPRVRDRKQFRKGTRRQYRSDINGIGPAGSAKVRWEKMLR